jgi:hypothetical protein
LLVLSVMGNLCSLIHINVDKNRLQEVKASQTELLTWAGLSAIESDPGHVSEVILPLYLSLGLLHHSPQPSHPHVWSSESRGAAGLPHPGNEEIQDHS